MISLRGLVDNIIYLHYRNCDFEMLLPEFQRRIQEETLTAYLDMLVELPCNDQTYC